MEGTLRNNDLKAEAQLKVVNEGGTLTADEDTASIKVTDADAVTLILACGTDYKMELPSFRSVDPHDAITKRVNDAAQASNLGECLIPYNDYLEVLRQAGRGAAASAFGIKSNPGEENGWLVGCFSTPYMFATMGQKNNAAGWNPTGSAWALLNSYEYYLYTGDKAFLQELYPSLKEVANFWNEALYWSEYQQRYVSSPSYSPENGPIVSGASYDQQFIWQHFENTIQAAVGGGNSGFLKNLFSSHGGGSNYKDYPIFQIDGNYGYTAGVNEMLLQSQLGYVQFLPAVPEQWNTGYVDGIVARGNFVIDMKWTDGVADSFVVTSRNGGEFIGKYADKISFQTQGNETYTISKDGSVETAYQVNIAETQNGQVSIPKDVYSVDDNSAMMWMLFFLVSLGAAATLWTYKIKKR